jgi:hypothetical protein
VRGENVAEVLSANPVALADAEKTVDLVQFSLPPPPETLARQIAMATATVVAVGEETSIFATASRSVGKTTLRQEDVQAALADACGREDDFFQR